MISGVQNVMMLANGVSGALPEGLILDVVPNAKTAYSTARKLKASATYIFEATRGNSSNEANQIIGFVNNEVNEAALLSFISSSTNAKIRFWADQSGNAINASSGDLWAVAGAIYRSSTGGLIKQNGKLSMRFLIDGTENYYLPTVSNEFGTLNPEYTVFMVAKPNNNTAQLAGTDGANGGANTVVRLGTGSCVIADSGGHDITATGQSNLAVMTAYKRSGDREIRINGVAQATTTTVSTRNVGIHRIGGSPFFAPPNNYDGLISEIIIYERALSDPEILAVEESMMSFYGIT